MQHRVQRAVTAGVEHVSRFPTEHHFASYTGSAPLDASSGKHPGSQWTASGHRRRARGGPVRGTNSPTVSPLALTARSEVSPFSTTAATDRTTAVVRACRSSPAAAAPHPRRTEPRSPG
ncbi:transposase [Streptomyces sp. NPDC055817]